MHFNQNNREFSKMEKVKVTTPKIGDFSAVECLDYNVKVPVANLDLCVQKYLLPFLHYFTREVNRKYVKGRNLIVAPYDWRLSPCEYTRVSNKFIGIGKLRSVYSACDKGDRCNAMRAMNTKN